MRECDLYFHTILTFVRLSLNNGRTIASATTVTDVGDRELSWWFCISTSFDICDIKTSLFTFLPSKIVFLLPKLSNYPSKVTYSELETYCTIKPTIVL